MNEPVRGEKVSEMISPVMMLRDFRPEHGFFIGIDSDGCVFDTMELKHKECFCPAFIGVFGLQSVSRYAREVWEFVNLYSKSRGTNRYIALIRALELLAQRREVIARGVTVPRLMGLRRWVESGAVLSTGSLRRAMEESGDKDLALALLWSEEVEAAVRKIARTISPFPGVIESLNRLLGKADLMVVSQTPGHTVEREWNALGISKYVRLIAGQEMGTKAEHIRFTAGGKYPPKRILMVGDAPGDAEAAAENGALFYPIIPHREEESWERFLYEGHKRFLDGTFSGAYQQELLSEFSDALPESASWEL